MNLDRKLFARVTIAGNKINLGYAALDELMMRVTREYVKTKASSGEYQVIVELSTSQLPESPIMNREDQLLHEMQSLYMDDSEVIHELESGETITARMIADAFSEPVYMRYYHVCDPQNRVGMNQGVIDEAKSEFDEKYPHWREANQPGWIDS